MRLQKFLARAGVASRRGSEDLMTAGRVAVNGVVTTELGAKIDPNSDEITVDGRQVRISDEPVYLVLNKPSGYVTTMDDPQQRPTVRELMPPDVPGLFPVGRLDMNTTGVLLFTTDGDLSFRVLHPSFHVTKVYRALVDGLPTSAELARLRDGIVLDDGPCKPALVEMLDASRSASLVGITLSEGRKRQVKRMFSAIGHPVLELHRSSFGPVSDAGLELGAIRPLTAAELDALRRASATGEDECS